MEKKGGKTLLWSVLMSAPGPLILAIGLMQGKSNTQIADFIRRTMELLAIIAAFAAYRITVKKQLDAEKTARLEKGTNLFVAITMVVAGIIMLCITLFDQTEDSGNVLFSLIIALLGVTANTLFWFRYRRLARLEQSAILEVQAKLYRAKSLVDFCVSSALLAVMLAPGTQISYYLDMIGSFIVSVYLGYSGLKILIPRLF